MRQKAFVEIFVLVVVALSIVAAIFYFGLRGKTIPYFQNREKSMTTTKTTKNTQTKQDSEEEPLKIIIDGKTTFIDKNKFTNPHKLEINNIRSHEVAPNKSGVAILARSDIGELLFIYYSDSNKVSYIDLADEIEWSHDSKYLAYTSPVTDIGPHRLVIYQVDSDTIKELQQGEVKIPTKYSNLVWGEQDDTITTNYWSYKIPGGEKITEGEKTYTIEQFRQLD